MHQTLSQAAPAVMMIRPVRFCYNEQTAVDNAFMNNTHLDSKSSQEKALKEFNAYVDKLESKGVKVLCFEDTYEPHTPDSIFCNNWLSFHEDGTLILYPMKAENRRVERRMDIIEDIQKVHGFKVKEQIDFSGCEEEGIFLEGTGSIIFDYINKIAYACISQRTDKDLLDKVCKKIGFTAHTFHSVDTNGQEIYHTNVMMCLSERYAMVCLQSIRDETEKENLIRSLTETGHEIVPLTYQQIENFSGNALEVCNDKGEKFLIVSKSGYDSLTEEQKAVIEQSDEILPMPLETIETIGGGSARCMIADVRLPKNLD